MSAIEVQSGTSAPLLSRLRPRKGSFLHRLMRNPVGMQGAVMMALMLFVAVFAGVLSPYGPSDQFGDQLLQAPSLQHPLGTDHLGRDVFSRIAHGARLAWMVGLVAVGLGAAGGVTLGLIAGFFRGWLDDLIMRAMDVILAFPRLIFLIAIVGVLGPSLLNALIGIGIGMMPAFARVTRGQVLSIKETDYVQAAISLGSGSTRVIRSHVFPNVLPILIVQASLAFSTAILAESTLSFLGLGSQPPEPSWGSMLNLSRAYMEYAPWLAIAPGLAVMISVLGFNQLGDGLRDVLDPRLRGKV